ncbi:hypothetical protein L202_02942 [Cryptococcus amylolentus CBS 6039]|uniref:Carboxylesterase type B domain-containing protein n=1 Tax=Cryptococcus amylolentus CBS 6039 TaxID=1295533 RepID=A0A1E3HWU0_9TREE|nr:hypothetical protein L202_02942 [Cryptococcus amylolentus CBS 6039]ODN80792.1 hypothetical protein L202_02942 [Cryptococcus amylolentus CBS 6039]
MRFEFLALLGAVASSSAAVIAPRNTTSSSSDLPQVSLNYSTIRAYETGSTSAGNYYVFKNIRYAAPPVGDLRWAAPQDPVQEDSVNNGTWSNTTGTSGCAEGEDCLFLDVYVPESALNSDQKLPVLFWNYGGGWTGGSKEENTPEGLLEVSNNSLIFVSYNYRLGIFGVLNGPTLQRAGGVSNVAIYDARKALEWVDTYIGNFGGDSDEVTNWGFSAGGSQVVAALTAFGGNKWTPTFKRAVVNSPGWVPGAGHARAEQYLQNVTELVGGCPTNTSDTISCLRNVSFDTLLEASENITSTYNYQMQPRADGVVLPDTSEYLLSIGQFHKDVQVLLGHSAHESNSQATSDVDDDASYRAMFKTIFPSITDWAIDQIEDLYPASDYSSQGLRFSAAKQHYDIPGKLLPLTNAYGNQTYNYVNYLGTATHGSDQTYWWYSNSSSTSDDSSSSSTSSIARRDNSTSTASGSYNSTTSSSSSNSTDSSSPSAGGGSAGGGGMDSSLTTDETLVALQMQRYLVSFVLTGDPNTYASGSTGNLSTIDSWPLYGSEDQVVEFQPSGAGFNITGDELDSAQVVFWNKALWY